MRGIENDFPLPCCVSTQLDAFNCHGFIRYTPKGHFVPSVYSEQSSESNSISRTFVLINRERLTLRSHCNRTRAVKHCSSSYCLSPVTIKGLCEEAVNQELFSQRLCYWIRGVLIRYLIRNFLIHNCYRGINRLRTNCIRHRIVHCIGSLEKMLAKVSCFAC